MGLGTSIFLIAVGAILDFAVETNVTGFNIHAVGVILMLVGVLGAALSMLFWNSWGGFNRRRTTVYEDPAYYDRPIATRRRVIDEEIN
ncbi:MAG TPA: DUF6458 family protein [Actinomycetota bacterium]|nr:DUF6458 family protein [Actinomycetota bacterium]